MSTETTEEFYAKVRRFHAGSPVWSGGAELLIRTGWAHPGRRWMCPDGGVLLRMLDDDNIAAYWVPDAPFGVGEERHFRYRITTFGDQLASQTLARVERTRIGGAALPGQTNPPPPALRRFIVDFTGAALSGLDPSAPIEAVLQTSAGTLSQIRTQQLPDALGWRVSFRLDPDRNSPSDMRLYLEIEGAPVSETWTYVWYADQER